MNLIEHAKSLVERSKTERTFGFAAQGRGIRKRIRDLHTPWENHRERSCAAQTSWLQQIPKSISDITVLGAGTLWDLSEEIPQRFSKIQLVDIDRAVRRSWQHAARNHPQTTFQYRFEDATGLLLTGANQLELELSEARSFEDALAIVENFDFRSPAHIPWAESTSENAAVLSLNLFSQLPLFWYRAVLATLKRRFRIRRSSEQQVINVTQSSQRRLLIKHMANLIHHAHGHLLVISDVLYAEYSVLPGKTYSGTDSPIELSSTGEVRILDDAIDHTIQLVYAITEPDLISLIPNGYRAVDIVPPWHWHIAPSRTAKHTGWVHLVKAVRIEAQSPPD